MKASEVLQRYAEGRRDFRGENLRGLSFRGKDLSGADFTEADIRGTNFRDATLRGTKFTKAKAGLQKRWVILMLMVCLVLVVLSGFFCTVAGYAVADLLLNAGYNIGLTVGNWVTIIFVLCFLGLFLPIIRQELNTSFVTGIFIGIFIGIFSAYTFVENYAFAIAFVIAYAFAFGTPFAIIAFGIPFAIAYAFAFAIAFAIAYTFAKAIAITKANTFTYAYAIADALAYAIAEALAIGYTIALTIAFAIATSEVSGLSRLTVGIITSSIILILGLLYVYINWRGIKGDHDYAFIRWNAIAIAALTGTCFRNADLTNADFSNALLKNTDLRSATLIRTCWRNAKKLDLATLNGTILFEAQVRELLVTGRGHRKSFEKADLRGANLTDTDLSYAHLRQADLSQATLRGANLEGAILTQTNCVGANFTTATLTAACLEAWNIDSTTTLNPVNCDYVFLLEEPDPKTGSRERRPHNPDAVFQPGDLEKLYRQIMNTVEILLRNGVDFDAFGEAFNQLVAEYPETRLKSLEQKDEDILVKLVIPEDTDKIQVEHLFREYYKALLDADVRHRQSLTQIIDNLS